MKTETVESIPIALGREGRPQIASTTARKFAGDACHKRPAKIVE
jgi:hypothetical protein